MVTTRLCPVRLDARCAHVRGIPLFAKSAKNGHPTVFLTSARSKPEPTAASPECKGCPGIVCKGCHRTEHVFCRGGSRCCRHDFCPCWLETRCAGVRGSRSSQSARRMGSPTVFLTARSKPRPPALLVPHTRGSRPSQTARRTGYPLCCRRPRDQKLSHPPFADPNNSTKLTALSFAEFRQGRSDRGSLLCSMPRRSLSERLLRVVTCIDFG